MTEHIVCKKCGWSEPAHSCEDINQKLARPGYEKTLHQCLESGGYRPESKEIEKLTIK